MANVNILDFFNKEKNQRFVDKFRGGNEYIRNAVYTEVIDNEVYKTVDNGVFQFYKKAKSETCRHNNVVENQSRMFLNVPKIPYKYYEMLIDWYRAVYFTKGTEACLLFYWNENDVEIPAELYEEHKDGLIIDGKLIVYCPIQWNSSVLSQFATIQNINGVQTSVLPEMVKWLERNTICYMETHSH